MTVVYEDDWVQLHHGKWQDIAPELLATEVVDAIITDPPYGETSLEWDRWPVGWPARAASLTKALWCFGSMRMFLDRRDEFADWRYSQEVVWEKHNGSGFNADRFKRVHEFATLWYQGEWEDIRHVTPTTADATSRTVRRKTRPAHTGHIEQSAYRSEDGGPRLMRSVQFVRSEHGRAIHPTQKPEGIVAPLIDYSVPAGGLVVDLFAGSATTAIAARNAGRRCIAFEMREDYAHAAAARLAQQTFVFEGVGA